MPKQRSVMDLYVRGKELTIDDGEGEVTVWIQKLNPTEYTKASRKADAARARILMAFRDKEGEEYTGLLGDVLKLTNDEKLRVLVSEERKKLTPMVEEEIGLSDKWNEGYIQGLRDAWNEELAKTFVDDPDDPEAKRTHDELVLFMEEVDAKVKQDLENFQAGLEMLPERELDEAVLRFHTKNYGDASWLEEFTRAEIWLGVRKADDHSVRIFDSRADVDLVQAGALMELSVAFREVTVDPVEGKDSAGIPPSSASSEASDKEETDLSSGQPAAAA